MSPFNYGRQELIEINEQDRWIRLPPATLPDLNEDTLQRRMKRPRGHYPDAESFVTHVVQHQRRTLATPVPIGNALPYDFHNLESTDLRLRDRSRPEEFGRDEDDAMMMLERAGGSNVREQDAVYDDLSAAQDCDPIEQPDGWEVVQEAEMEQLGENIDGLGLGQDEMVAVSGFDLLPSE